MIIETVKIREHGYLVNDIMSVPNEPSNRHYQLILDWINEIHEYTNDIYNDVSIDDKLGYEYQYKNFDTVRELLLLGGLRLAKILNYLFD